MDRDEIKLTIRNVKNLPTLPGVATRILQVTQDTGSSAIELANIIRNDPTVSAKVLNLANSSFYGFSQRITTIPQAVVVLGFDMIRSLALGVSVFHALAAKTSEPSFEWDGFWLHSIGCGTAAKIVARDLGIRDEGTLFVAGLLHDLAKVFLDLHFRDSYHEVMKKVEAGEGPSYEIEREVMGVDHAEIGAWLAFRWKFPDLLLNPIAGHHDLSKVEEPYLRDATIVHLANILTKRAGIGAVYHVPVANPDDRVQSLLKLAPERVDRMSQDLGEQKAQIEEFFGYLGD
jgi:HD-like signal output (HDOD) protein